jgi:ATP-dependent helicase/nuclease subunit A
VAPTRCCSATTAASGSGCARSGRRHRFPRSTTQPSTSAGRQPRAREKLILSGTLDVTKPPQPRPGGAPLCWISHALLDDVAVLAAGPRSELMRTWDGRPARLALTVSTPGAGLVRPAAPVRAPAVGTSLPVAPALARVPVAAAAPALAGLPRRLSYTSLGAYGRCGYRWYLQRVLGLPDAEAPPVVAAGGSSALVAAAAPEPPAPPPGLDPRVRGTLVHVLLEELDFARPQAPSPQAIEAVAAANGAEPTPEEAADVAQLVAAFGASPLCARLAAARGVRREAPFAFALEPGPGSLLVHGVVDVLATEADGSVLVVDYKTDRLGDAEPEALTERDYGTQRLVYALAALREGAPRVEVAHCYLERPDETALATFTARDADALAERLVGVAGGVLRAEFPVAQRPHRELCGTCPGRKALCSHPEALTLRSPEQALAA